MSEEIFGVDSHCHLNDFEDVAAVIQKAKENDIRKMVTISTSFDEVEQLISICENFPNVVDMTIGVHPDNAELVSEDLIAQYFHYLEKPFVIGVGEIGLDYRDEPSSVVKKQQQKIFEYQIELSQTYGVPICIHARNCFEDVIGIITHFPNQTGVCHCFTGGKEEARKILDLGYYISITGIVTFKNATILQEAVRYIPLDRLLIETDAPYLAPVPYRGKKNEPAWVRITAEYIAGLKQDVTNHVLNITADNFFRLFKKSVKTYVI